MIPMAVGDNVICQVIPESKTSAGGIIMPETATKQLPQKNCKVLSVGELVEANIIAGDTVVVHQQAGQAMFFDNKIYIVLKGPEIYGIVDRSPEVKTALKFLQENEN